MKIKAMEIKSPPRNWEVNNDPTMVPVEINISKKMFDNWIKIRDLYNIYKLFLRKKFIKKTKKEGHHVS